MSDFWLDNAASLNSTKTARHILLDLGNGDDKKTFERADGVASIVSKINFQYIGYGCGRLLCRIPPTKLKAVLNTFPKIKEKTTFAWCTHGWIKG